MPTSVLDNINQQVDNLNLIQVDPKAYHKDLRKTYNDILKLLKKELKIVPKHYYRNMWLAVGMSSFGIPIGVAFGLALDNMGFIGIGLPIGMSIGIAIGAGMDNKAKEEGKQLDIDL
ncbi:hypothetical protein EIG84_01925 [Flavobacteriaceae bacterium 14752]|nr:hypothetical protein EIG84_01925 [Flavobacteriaceae bacterium 14752]